MTIEEAGIRWLKARDEWQAAKEFHSDSYRLLVCANDPEIVQDGPVDPRYQCYKQMVPDEDVFFGDAKRRLRPNEWCPACQETWKLRQEVVRLARKKGAAQSVLTKLIRKKMS